jgi:methyl-accepting chemotaxis protein
MTEITAPAPPGWEGRLGLGHKLMLAMGGLMSLMTVVILLAILLVARLGAAQMRLNEQDVPFAGAASAAALQAKGVANDERGFLISGDRRYLAEAETRIALARSDFAAARRSATRSEEQRVMEEASAGFDHWVAALRQEFTTYAHDPDAAVTASLGPTRELRKNYEASLAHARSLAQASINRDDSSVAATASHSMRVLLGCLAAVLAIGLLVSRWIIQLIALPVHRLLSLMSG